MNISFGVLTRVKLALMVMALIFFTASLRTGVDWHRFMGIGLLVVAFLLRFIKPSGQR